MSEKTKIYCDRCSKKIENDIKRNIRVVVKDRHGHYYSRSDFYFDYCDECLKKIIHVLFSKENDNEKNSG